MSRNFFALAAGHIGKRVLIAFGQSWDSPIGVVTARDVGKRVYLVGDTLQAENDAQRDARRAKRESILANSEESLGRMVTEERAESVARTLFPDEYASGDDCKAERGREGQPCRICAAAVKAWRERVAEVRAAMIEAFR